MRLLTAIRRWWLAAVSIRHTQAVVRRLDSSVYELQVQSRIDRGEAEPLTKPFGGPRRLAGTSPVETLSAETVQLLANQTARSMVNKRMEELSEQEQRVEALIKEAEHIAASITIAVSDIAVELQQCVTGDGSPPRRFTRDARAEREVREGSGSDPDDPNFDTDEPSRPDRRERYERNVIDALSNPNLTASPTLRWCCDNRTSDLCPPWESIAELCNELQHDPVQPD